MTICLFYAYLLEDDIGIMSILEKSDKDLLSQLLLFLFFHSAQTKDMLAFPTVDTMWSSTGSIGETDLMTFQTVCLELLQEVF